MINPLIIVEITLVYFAALFAVAYFVEKKYTQDKNFTDNAVVYTLSLAIYCTAWTFFGNVGLASTTSFLFLGVYIGPTLFFIFWKEIISKILKLKEKYAVTSIAGLLSLRYGKSQSVAVLATLIALVGIVPYLSLQLKAIFSSYAFVTTGSVIHTNRAQIDWALLSIIVIFIISFGMRKLDQTERHPGLVMVVAIQSVVKLAAFLAVGIFVTYFLHNGFGDIFSQIAANEKILSSLRANAPSPSLFLAYTILSVSAIMFLPRQFHMAVVENSNKKHLRTAVWLLPLYLIVITVFVFPIAMHGLLHGHDASVADNFILHIPLSHGSQWISLLVFIGGISAAFSMILISGIAIASMTTNYLVAPIIEKTKWLSFFRHRLLLVRWLAVIALMLIAYVFEIKIGSSHVLVKIGMISFAAVLQFAPATIGGLYWKKSGRTGALIGMAAGFLVWFYTSLFPALVRSDWLNMSILSDGPGGIRFLRPENLFGITSLDPLALTVLWSMIFNVGFFIVGSLFFGQSEKEKQTIPDFFGDGEKRNYFLAGAALQEKKINLEEKKKIVASIFGKYVSEGEALNLAEQCREKANIENTSEITLDELIEFNSATERTLSSYIGAPAANVAVSEEKLISEEETEHLSALYAQKAAELKLTPKELHEKIDYYAEKEELLKKQSAELEKIVKERTKNLEEKNKELENSKKAMLNLLEDFKEAQEKERLAHESVALQKERAESILNYLQSIAEAVFATDVSENIVFINRTAKSLLPKETRDQVELQKAQDTFQFVEEEGNKKKPVYPVMSSLEHSSSFKFPKNSYLRTGQKDIPIDGICSPFAKGGKNLGAICVFQDITERHNLEKEKDDFLSIAAHQLRTPLSGIRWMIESLLEGDDGELPTEAQKTLDQIYENNQRLIVLINDLLDVSKINMGKSKEDPISVNICEKLKDAAESMAGLAKERHVSISYEKICALNPIVEIGPRHFFQVLQNLISNAVKYTPKEGSVKVSVDFKENKVTISVSDTGIGIPKDEQDKIFKKFFRASNAALKETEGSGLGLSVVKSYIEEAGGRIWFESRERKGTTFFVELPVAKAS